MASGLWPNRKYRRPLQSVYHRATPKPFELPWMRFSQLNEARTAFSGGPPILFGTTRHWSYKRHARSRARYRSSRGPVCKPKLYAGANRPRELLRLAQERNARVILSGDTRQHGAVDASDALLAIERYSGIKPVELRTIRRQDPALARNQRERVRIKQYRKAVEAAAAGKLVESFKRLDQMGAIVACGLGEQADKLADEYLRLAAQSASAVVVSQTWAEVHRVNSRVRDSLKSKGLLGLNDVTIQVLEKCDLTNAQKRDARFYQKDSVVVFNQKVRQTCPGAPGKLLGIVKAGVLVEVDGRCVTVANKLLDKITVCLPREFPVAEGERLHLKSNRKLAGGGRAINGDPQCGDCSRESICFTAQ